MLSSQEEEYCGDCAGTQRSFQWNTALLTYDNTARETMAWFKYHGRREYADFYGEEICRRYQKRLLSVKPQAIVPVPLHPSRKKKRGYNQAEELAKVLGQKLGIPVRPELLKRGRNTEALKTLSPAGRYQSLAGAFQAGRKKCPYSSVLLVDDIYTTGATMEGCSRVLREMGAEKIYGVTVCVGRGDG